MYTGDNNSYEPLFKYDAGGSIWYPNEMARFTSADFNSGLQMGWENLGLLFSSKLIPDGHLYYCPSNPKDTTSTYSYDFYVSVQHPIWPFGCFDNAALAGTSNPGYVRSGYTYFPQNVALDPAQAIPGLSSVGSVQLPTINDQLTTGNQGLATDPVSKWNVVKAYREDALDTKKAIASDNLYNQSDIFHKKGNYITGINVLFTDGHVSWQSASANAALFDPNGVWSALDANTMGQGQTDMRYLMYSWQ
jgi:prepilin-type processing-associated H-X9-DG protein